jgi:hypothetical protein
MPDLCGYQNIRDFIACVSYGCICGAIHPVEAPRLLYGAQVAISALRLQPKDSKVVKRKKKPKTAKTPPPTSSSNKTK